MKLTISSRRRFYFSVVFAVAFACMWVVYSISTHYRGWTAPFGRISRAWSRWVGFTSSSFRFQQERPLWLAQPAPRPLLLQIAVISAADEFEQRAFLRDYVYSQVPSDEVLLNLNFFVAQANAPHVQWTSTTVDQLVHEENATFGDINLIPIVENTFALCRKRFEAVKWAAQTPQKEYDFLFTVDTDSFVRLTALARRMHHLRPDLLNPRTQYSMWGSMMSNWRHWHKSYDMDKPDEVYNGEWYDYPIGQGYLLSSALVARLDAVSEELPHYLPYYRDDMAVGAWVAEFAPETMIINDLGGFHDPPWHGLRPYPIDYGTVLIHHVNVPEMAYLRKMKEWEGEWLPFDDV